MLVAIGLITVAWRGAAIDNHPLCRRCGFDLFGKPAAATRCGECGADLHRRRAIRIGHRRKRRGLLGAGALLLVIILGVGGTVGYGKAQHVNWWHYSPFWFILREAGSTDAIWRGPALQELQYRYAPLTAYGSMSSQPLSGSQVDQLIEAGLAYQKDQSKPWDDAWGILLETMATDGRMPADKWSRYMSQGIDGAFSLSVRKFVRRGDPVPYALDCRAGRVSTYAASTWDASFSNATFELGGNGNWHVADGYSALRPGLGFGWTEHRTCDSAHTETLSNDCLQRARFRAHVKIITVGGAAVENDIELISDFTLLPSSNRPLKINADPKLNDAITKMLSIEFAELERHGGAKRFLRFRLRDEPPVALAFDVLVGSAGNEIHVGSITFAKLQYCDAIQWVQFPWPDGTHGPVNVILRANPNLALESMDIYEIWGGEIVFKELPVP